MKKLDLTFVIIAQRPTDQLKQTLRTITQFGQVLIVNTGSRVDWQQLTPNSGLLLLDHRGPIKHFSKIRNWVIEKVDTTWIFFIDSDEVLTAGQARKIKPLLNQDNTNGFLIKRRDYFLGKPLNYGEVGKVRLLRLAKTKNLVYNRPVHEVGQVSGRVEQSQITLRHYPHQSISSFIDKVTSYAATEASNRKQTHLATTLQLLFYPKLKFLYNYFIKLGLLDGWRGLVYATMMSLHSISVRAFLIEDENQN